VSAAVGDARRLVAVVLVEQPHRLPTTPGELVHLAEQVVDDLVADRGDADALAGAQQREDRERAGVALARAGRALHG
jgi:hypothetical protein